MTGKKIWMKGVAKKARSACDKLSHLCAPRQSFWRVRQEQTCKESVHSWCFLRVLSRDGRKGIRQLMSSPDTE